MDYKNTFYEMEIVIGQRIYLDNNGEVGYKLALVAEYKNGILSAIRMV